MAETGMVEKVARASFRYWRENATRKGVHLDRPQTFDEMPPEEREFALGHARAAIEAMREPTEEMVNAGAVAEGDTNLEAQARSLWEAMIDAILKDGD